MLVVHQDEEGSIAEDDEEDVVWQVDENEAFVARRFKRRLQLRRAGNGGRKGKGHRRGRFRSNLKGSSHTAKDDSQNSSFYEKEKVRAKTNGRAEQKKLIFQRAKEKAKRKAREKANPVPAATAASSTEDWSWYAEESWLPWEEGADLATHETSKRKKKPHGGKKKCKKLCNNRGSGTDGPVHLKPDPEKDIPECIASASSVDVAQTRKNARKKNPNYRNFVQLTWSLQTM